MKTPEQWALDIQAAADKQGGFDSEQDMIPFVEAIRKEALEQNPGTLTRILKLCEAFQNQDIEGKDEEDELDDAELIIGQITEMTVVELAHQSHALQKPKTEEAAAMIQALEIVAMIERLISESAILIKMNNGQFKCDVWRNYHSHQRLTLHAALTAAIAAKKQTETGNS